MQNGAVTYKDMSLSIREAIAIENVEILQKPGEHAWMCVKAILDSEMEENDFHGIHEQVFLTYQNGSLCDYQYQRP